MILKLTDGVNLYNQG